MPVPPATGRRIGWVDLPDEVRAAVGRILGAPVVAASSEPGGFSPGSADRVRTADGKRAFVKAVSPTQNPDSPDLLRREADHLEVLSAVSGVPDLIGRYDDGTWVAMVLAEVDGACPPTPWRAGDLERSLAALRTLADALTPSPLPDLASATDELRPLFEGWRRLLDDPDPGLDPWLAPRLPALRELAESTLPRLAGETVVHADIRADNLLVSADGTVTVVDWPWAMRGAAWLDRFLLLINVDLHGGHDVDALVAQHLPDVDPAVITGCLAGMCAYFVDAARLRPAPGLPTLRAFQRAQAESTTAWLRRRWPDDRPTAATEK